MPYLTPDSIDPVEVLRVVLVSQNVKLWGALTDAIDELGKAKNWEQFGLLTADEVAAYFFEVAWRERQMTVIGVMLPYASQDCPSFALPCDGTQYNRVDYPNLYAVLDPAFIVDADHFVTPDLRSRTIVGAGQGAGLTDYDPGDTGGEETHVLTSAEMAAHTHTDTGHVHTEVVATPVVLPTGAGVPVPAALSGVGITGSSAANLTSSGGGGAHENRPPYVALNWCIIAF